MQQWEMAGLERHHVLVALPRNARLEFKLFFEVFLPKPTDWRGLRS